TTGGSTGTVTDSGLGSGAGVTAAVTAGACRTGGSTLTAARLGSARLGATGAGSGTRRGAGAIAGARGGALDAGEVSAALFGFTWLVPEREHEERSRQKTEKSKTYWRMRISMMSNLSD